MKTIITAVLTAVVLSVIGTSVVWQTNLKKVVREWAYGDTSREPIIEKKEFGDAFEQEMTSMQMEYLRVDSEASASLARRSAIRSMILSRVSDYDEAKFPKEFKRFLDEIRKGEK